MTTLRGLLERRRRAIAYGLAVLLPGAVTLGGALRAAPAEGVGGRLYLLSVALVAFAGGLAPALVATACSFAGLAYYYTPPARTLEITGENLAALASFLVAAVVISELLDRLRGARGRTDAALLGAAQVAERNARLQAVTAALVEAHTTDDVLEVMLREATGASGGHRGLVAVVAGDELEVRAQRGYSEAVMTEWRRFPIDGPLPLSEAVRTGKGVYLSTSGERDERYPALAGLTSTSHAMIALPLAVEGRAVGGFVVSFEEEREFEEGERELLEGIARQCAQAFERARLHEAEAEARAKLAEQKAVLEAEGEASSDAILLVSPGGEIVSFNRRFVELWRIPAEVVETRSDAAALASVASLLADPEAFYARVEYLYGHPEEESREEIELLDGRILERLSAPVRGDDGAYYGRVWYFRDVTEHRRREQIGAFLAEASRLLASAARVEDALQEVVRLPIPQLLGAFTVELLDDAGTPRVVATANAEREKEELVRELRRRYPPASPEHPVRQAIERRETVSLLELDDRLLRRLAQDDEHLRLLRATLPRSGVVVPIAVGDRVYGVVSVGVAPGRPRLPPWKVELAEEAALRIGHALDRARLLQEAERRGDAARALEHVADGVLLVDHDERVRFWNPAATAILRLDASALGQAAEDVVPGWAALRELPSDEPGGSRTVPVERNGREAWLSVSLVEFDEGTVLAFADVTEERTLEAMRAEFVTTASHQLRTPLAAVYGAARTLLREDVELPAESREAFLRMIVRESDRLAVIVDEILLADYLTSGEVEVAVARCDGGEVARRVIEAARAGAPDGIALTLDVPAGPQPVLGDEERLRQVLANLVDNAVKYSPGGGEVALAVEGGDGVRRFAVRDRGLGIPPADRERIFEKFFRLDPQLRQGIGGTGLGLYICRELVARMGGRIWVEPREGGGSVFFVELAAA